MKNIWIYEQDRNGFQSTQQNPRFVHFSRVFVSVDRLFKQTIFTLLPSLIQYKYEMIRANIIVPKKPNEEKIMYAEI